MLYVNGRRLIPSAAAAGLMVLLAGGIVHPAWAAKPTTTVLGAFTTQDWPVMVQVRADRRRDERCL
jgi:hypothetical protein